MSSLVWWAAVSSLTGVPPSFPPHSHQSHHTCPCLKASQGISCHCRIKLWPLAVACSSLCDRLIVPLSELISCLFLLLLNWVPAFMLFTHTTLGLCTLPFPPLRNQTFGSMGSWAPLVGEVVPRVTCSERLSLAVQPVSSSWIATDHIPQFNIPHSTHSYFKIISFIYVTCFLSDFPHCYYYSNNNLLCSGT